MEGVVDQQPREKTDKHVLTSTRSCALDSHSVWPCEAGRQHGVPTLPSCYFQGNLMALV